MFRTILNIILNISVWLIDCIQADITIPNQRGYRDEQEHPSAQELEPHHHI